MKVKAVATKTVGIGCIKGDRREYTAQRVEDKGTYYEVVVHDNWSVRFAKDAWSLTKEG